MAAFIQKPLDFSIFELTPAAIWLNQCLIQQCCQDVSPTRLVSLIFHIGGPVHKTRKGEQVEGEDEHVDLEEVVGGQAFQVDEGLCQRMTQ